RARRDEARSRQPLPPVRRAGDAHDGRPADAHAALPRRGERLELLPEAGAEIGAPLAGDDRRGPPGRADLAGAGGGGHRPPRVGGLGFKVWPNRAADPEHADELRLDLDPQPGTDFTDIRAAAANVRAFLDELGIVGYPKTTGNRGIHVYIRLEPRWDSYDVRRAAVAAARELERRHPD